MANSTVLLMATVTGLTGGIILSYFNAMRWPLLFLVVVMAIDFITGIAGGALFKSSKTDKGGLESHVCAKGIAQKTGILMIVVLGGLIDLLFGVDYFCNTIIVGFMFSEVISVIENCGAMGVPMPKAVTNMVEKLRMEDEKHENAE